METSIEQILSNELSALQSDVISRHERARQVVSGKTRNAFEVQVFGNAGELLGASYAGVLERGRGAGKVPYNFGEILQRWAAQKGITFKSPADAKRWAYFVSKKIKDEGTALYRSKNTIDIFTQPIANFQERLQAKIAVFYQSEISNKIFEK
ncbi:hypothetical protein FACS189434_09370 [Bacteroidia bacterium]|nr:hypothetical protein FACS189434_09370 [Bacteroidia bacterium]